MWGCDTWTPEESFGALLAFRHVASSVLAEKVMDGYFTIHDAYQIIENICSRNAAGFFRLEIKASEPNRGKEVNEKKQTVESC